VHDVDYVCGRAQPPSGGDPAVALAELERYGLAEGQEAQILEGDQYVLDAVLELRRMKSEGIIKAVGISGEYRDISC
jgi:D-arabinose 1-dehydrogenase